MLEPKDVFHEVIRINAPKVIIVHNHPSGDPTPSLEDLELTKRLIFSANMLGIQLLDHIIIAEEGCESIMKYIKN